VEDGADRLVDALIAKGARARRDEGRVLVAIDSDALYDTVRDSVADLAVPLVRIQQERGRLEDLFRDAAPGPVPPAAGSVQ
jgi:ABC-2 type transport system ATP-binding protein